MKILNLFKNRFFIAGVVFVVWIIFFAQYDIISLQRQRKELDEMQQKIIYLTNEIEKLEKEKKALQSDPKAIEKYAREHYYMHKNNEQVYIFDSLQKDSTSK